MTTDTLHDALIDLGHDEDAELLRQTLDGEKGTDGSLAEGGINQSAADAAEPQDEEDGDEEDEEEEDEEEEDEEEDEEEEARPVGRGAAKTAPRKPPISPRLRPGVASS
jgi:ribosomal protein L12E/L44/L45/RPP1/RPP2